LPRIPKRLCGRTLRILNRRPSAFDNVSLPETDVSGIAEMPCGIRRCGARPIREDVSEVYSVRAKQNWKKCAWDRQKDHLYGKL
jgi:hypothetical protein